MYRAKFHWLLPAVTAILQVFVCGFSATSASTISPSWGEFAIEELGARGRRGGFNVIAKKRGFIAARMSDSPGVTPLQQFSIRLRNLRMSRF